MKFFIGHKITGISKKSKNDCQDYYDFKETEAGIIAAVADGVGSEKYSAFGSKVACETVVKYCAEHIKKGMNDREVLMTIASSYNKTWKTVEEEARKNNIDVQQCNTTLSLVVFIDGDLYYGHVGDSGIFAFFTDGEVAPVTEQQNDSEGRVYTLSSGPTRWRYGKAEKKAVSVLLCTDGIWNMFFPSRLASEKNKHSVPLLFYYLNPYTIYEDKPEDDFQKWLVNNMEKINKNNPASVNFDDITMVILCDKDIEFSKQPDEYYSPPSEEDLKKAELEEYERLYGHLKADIVEPVLLSAESENDKIVTVTETEQGLCVTINESLGNIDENGINLALQQIQKAEKEKGFSTVSMNFKNTNDSIKDKDISNDDKPKTAEEQLPAKCRECPKRNAKLQRMRRDLE